jgi:hypothetical protein
MNVGKDFDVSLTATLPDDVAAGDFIEVYRTKLSASDTTVPTEEHFLVTKTELDSSDISAGTWTFTDDRLDVFLGERLYTSPSLGTRARPNHRPPLAHDIVEYQGHMLLFNTQREQEKLIQLKDTAGLTTSTSTITIGVEVYTAETAENVGNKEFKKETSFSTLAENVTATAKSLARVINRGSAAYYAQYASQATDSPGKILVRGREITTAQFAFVADSTATGGSFEPVIPTSGTDVQSEPPGATNEVAISKFEQPDAVPRLSTKSLASEDDRILRGFSLRDSVVVLKELNGVFVISGETDGSIGDSFTFRLADSSVRLLGASTPVVVANLVVGFTNLGFVAINGFGAVEIVGDQVEDDIRKISAFTNFKAQSHAFSYDSEGMYTCFTPKESADTEARLGWSYSVFNRKWFHGWEKKISAGHNLSADDKLYLAHAVDDFTLQERKDFTSSDFKDENITVTVDVVDVEIDADGNRFSKLDITYTYTGVTLQVGFLFTQGSVFSGITSVVDNGSNSYTVVLQEELPGLTAAAATVSIPIFVDLKTVPVVGGRSAAVLKQFPEVHYEFAEDTAFTHEIGFSSDIVPVESTFTLGISTLPQSFGWGTSPWGSSPWGDAGSLSATPIIVQTAPDYQYARRLHVLYKHNFANEQVQLSQISVVLRPISRKSSVKVPRLT